ncbi:MAG: hypothetical protein HUU35_12205, partial [Armatimonadetes bacterium]|nr:hypothetical protein [Armatimonadota bacterium]
MRLLLLLSALPCLGAEPLVNNAGFEQTRPATPGTDGLVNGWTVRGEVPVGWVLNSHYTGTLETLAEGAAEGQRFARLVGTGASETHLYQPIPKLQAGRWYRLSVRYRGGAARVTTYDYFQSGIKGQIVAEGGASADWRELGGFFQVGGEGWKSSTLALVAARGTTVDFDQVAIELMELPPMEAGAPEVCLENSTLRLTFGSNGRLKELLGKATGENYAAEGAPLPLLAVTRQGQNIPLYSLSQQGELLTARFLDPAVQVQLKVISRPRHFRFEVVSVSPDDIADLVLELPVRRLERWGGAFQGNYDERFGMCLFGATVNVTNRPVGRGTAQSLRCLATARHGLVGAAMILTAAPRAEFEAAIMEAERDNGLPCPILEGEWTRVSRAARKSYLFAAPVTGAEVDQLIEYARLGGFGTIMFLKDSWLANHGHFQINEQAFPGGLPALKQAVDKIHAAGLDAAVHVFGPSISPNDPYVTPVPDKRLAKVALGPLAEAVDAKAGTITLAAPPAVPLDTARSRAFPGNYLRLGDELIRYTNIEPGSPYRFVGCQRGALGTTAAAHSAGAPVDTMLNMWGFFLVDPDSTLADELTSGFGKVFNAAGFDFAYFDASDGILENYLDRWYYLNKLHLGYWRAIGRDVMYQTSNGTGSDLTWHMVPRSASADGHGDIKGYLDERWPGILNMGNNLTKADIGWYYWFRDVRPDQIEYVCAKAAALDGSISLETSIEALHRLAQSRQLMEMIGRWERARAAKAFDQPTRTKLLEMQKDFKLFDLGGWKLYRAAYEEPRAVDVLDGQVNTWSITHDGPPARLGLELVRGKRLVATADYQSAGTTIETFGEAAAYQAGGRNDFPKFVQGGGKQDSPTGPVRAGVTQSFEVVRGGAKVGPNVLVYRADNRGDAGGWGGIGRRFEQPLDLSGTQALGFWLHGDGNGEALRVQLRDSAGRNADLVVPVELP